MVSIMKALALLNAWYANLRGLSCVPGEDVLFSPLHRFYHMETEGYLGSSPFWSHGRAPLVDGDDNRVRTQLRDNISALRGV